MSKNKWWIDRATKDITHIVKGDCTQGPDGIYGVNGKLEQRISAPGDLMQPDAEQEAEYATLDPMVTGPPEAYREQVQAMIQQLAVDALAKEGITPPDPEVLYFDKGTVKKRKASDVAVPEMPKDTDTIATWEAYAAAMGVDLTPAAGMLKAELVAFIKAAVS